MIETLEETIERLKEENQSLRDECEANEAVIVEMKDSLDDIRRIVHEWLK